MDHYIQALHLEELRKRHLIVVLIGHVESGKSTTGGRMLSLSDQVKKWEKGTTVDVGRAYFETKTTRFTLLDTPGHKSYILNMITGASEADIAVLVVSAQSGKLSLAREHVILAKTFGISKLVIVVNKMDDATVEWSKERYDEIKTKMKPFLRSLGYNLQRDVQFLPISGLTGANIKERVDGGVCPWWGGPCLFEALDAVEATPRYPAGPVRFPIRGKYNEMGDTVVIGKVESGTIIKCDNTLLVMPGNRKVTVNAIYCDEDDTDEVIRGGPGENLRIKLSGIGEAAVGPGSVLCSGDNPIRPVTEFTAQLGVVEAPENGLFAPGYEAVLHFRSAVEECMIVKLKHRVDPATGMPVRKIFAAAGDVVVCRIQVKVGICLERFEDFPQLGRFTIRSQSKTIAMGIVTELGD